MQTNKHAHDNDLTRLIPAEPKAHRNPLLEHIEPMAIPPRGRGKKGSISQRMLDFMELLQLMVPQKDSILREKKDSHCIARAAKYLGYRVTYRVEDNRGIKLYRWWVLAQTLDKEEEGVQE